MRIDKFLKNSRLIKRRPIAKQACDSGRISINSKPAKPGDIVKIGDIIEIRLGANIIKAEILALFLTATKENAPTMYRLV